VPHNQVAAGVGMNLLARHGAFLLILVLYATVIALQIDHGLASGDGHGIVRSVETLLSNGRIDVSRPPGHPTTELYLFGATGWLLLKTFGIEFGDKIFLIWQGVAALAALVVFYELLLTVGASRVRAVLAAICLACSAQFLFNALDGEEFDFGLLFLLISVRLLIGATPASLVRLSLSILCFALATGCRPELVFAAIIFPIYYLHHSGLGWKRAIASIGLLVLAIAIVWMPIFLVGIRAPYTAGMNLRESILGGIYRIIFQAFTPAVFVLFAWTLILALCNLPKRLPEKDFVFTISCIVALIFLAVFFLHPSKAAHLLAAVPFLLLVAAGRSLALLIALSFFSLLSCFVNIDIFKDRQLTRPFLTVGSYSQAIQQKPYYKLDYLRKLFDQCEVRPAVIIGNASPWDFEYQIEHNKVSAREADLHGEIKRELPVFFANGEHCVFFSPEASYETALLKEWQQKGYAMKIDAKLYRTLFARYDVRSGLNAGTADISGVPFILFHID
jgi:hypothetical protein